MKDGRGFSPSGMSGFLGLEQPQVSHLFANPDLCSPSAVWLSRYALEASRTGENAIAILLGDRRFPKISPSIIHARPVPVINCLRRKIASLHNPDYPVRTKNVFIYRHFGIDILRSGNGACIAGVPSLPRSVILKVAPWANAPNQVSGFRVVLEKLAEVFRVGHHILSHEFSPYKRFWLGVSPCVNRAMSCSISGGYENQ